MDLKQYQEKMEAQIKELRTHLEALKAKANVAGVDAKIELTKQIEALKPKLEAAQQKLNDLSAASGPAWEKLKEGFEKAMAELKKGWGSSSKSERD
ncbi:MAG: coiled coil domain-containing protein [Deltaproteobacteria bacterium]|nr:coiled coil domain-containing protein [Deltaproteobacteria bacterium]